MRGGFTTGDAVLIFVGVFLLLTSALALDGDLIGSLHPVPHLRDFVMGLGATGVGLMLCGVRHTFRRRRKDDDLGG